MSLESIVMAELKVTAELVTLDIVPVFDPVSSEKVIFEPLFNKLVPVPTFIVVNEYSPVALSYTNVGVIDCASKAVKSRENWLRFTVVFSITCAGKEPPSPPFTVLNLNIVLFKVSVEPSSTKNTPPKPAPPPEPAPPSV